MLRKWLLGSIAATLLALAGGSAQAAGADAGQVLALAGACTAESGGRSEELKPGDTVHVGDTIEVPEGGKLRLRMADGSVLSVAAGSRMTVTSYTVDSAEQHRDARLSLAQGLVRAVVAKVSQPSTFEISTATGVAAARSTDWFVEAQPTATRVAVIEGTVAVTRPKGAGEVLVPPDEGTTIAPGKAPLPARVWPKSAFATLITATTVNIGWCQCIDERAAIQASCQASVGGCQAFCGGRHYSFLAEAPQSCGSGR